MAVEGQSVEICFALLGDMDEYADLHIKTEDTGFTLGKTTSNQHNNS